MDTAQVSPSEELRERLEMLIGLAEYELESVYDANRLNDEEGQDKTDIRAAVKWLKANMDFVIADAEFDGRI